MASAADLRQIPVDVSAHLAELARVDRGEVSSDWWMVGFNGIPGDLLSWGLIEWNSRRCGWQASHAGLFALEAWGSRGADAEV